MIGARAAASSAAERAETPSVIVEVWSDFVCPYCYIGKRRLEAAIEASGLPVTVVHRAFQLHPQAPSDRTMPIREFWPLVYGASADDSVLPAIVAAGRDLGLDLNYDIMQSCNTRTAHRLTKWAGANGRETELVEAMFEGYFSHGARLNASEDLARIAVRAGLDGAGALAAIPLG